MIYPPEYIDPLPLSFSIERDIALKSFLCVCYPPGDKLIFFISKVMRKIQPRIYLDECIMFEIYIFPKNRDSHVKNIITCTMKQSN